MPTVHVIFKTHLDIGFTDMAATVLRNYVESYIPEAIRRANELREAGGNDGFIWTTGSWLIYEYLEQADPAGRRAMEQAIANGDIRWHALPFTTHTEMCDPALVRFGLGLSQELDARFGRRTIAAKMTDVPGHTRGLVPLLAEAGVRFLHIGVNPASTAPAVPDCFRWRGADGSEVIVAYSSGSYGSTLDAPDCADLLSFAHTGDNCGPQDAAAIIAAFASLRAQHPGFTVRASTLDAFAESLLPHAAALPVIDQEIGDTWIHGLGTDPVKTAGFRALCRLRNGWEQDGRVQANDPGYRAFSRQLLCIPEHTWGMDVKSHLGDYVNYHRIDFAAARQRDLVDRQPAIYADIGACTHHEQLTPERRYSHLEASWAEQRSYIDQAIAALRDPLLRAEAQAALDRIKPQHHDPDGTPVAVGETITCGGYRVRVADDGSLDLLCRVDGRAAIADDAHPIGRYAYQTFSQDDYERYQRDYCRHMDNPQVRSWAWPDFGKPGMDAHTSTVYGRVRQIHHDDEHLCIGLALPAQAVTMDGAPAAVELRYHFTEEQILIDLTWRGKAANRMAEAQWLSFTPDLGEDPVWHLDKLGDTIDPLAVIDGGNRNLHAVGSGCSGSGAGRHWSLVTHDAPLIAPGSPRLLTFDRSQPDMRGGVHINLANNIWGTNFPMWLEGDCRFRFAMRLATRDEHDSLPV